MASITAVVRGPRHLALAFSASQALWLLLQLEEQYSNQGHFLYAGGIFLGS